jgi:hypothetical protein
VSPDATTAAAERVLVDVTHACELRAGCSLEADVTFDPIVGPLVYVSARDELEEASV